MEFDKAKFMEKLKELVAYGKKKKSVLEYQEIRLVSQWKLDPIYHY